MVVGLRGGQWEMSYRDQVPVLQNERVLWMEGGDGDTRMGMNSMPRLYT